MNAVGAFLPAASESTLEIPLQITRIANQNNATISAQNAEIKFHKFFLIFPSTSMPPIFFGSLQESPLFSRSASLERVQIDPTRFSYNIPHVSTFTTVCQGKSAAPGCMGFGCHLWCICVQRDVRSARLRRCSFG